MGIIGLCVVPGILTAAVALTPAPLPEGEGNKRSVPAVSVNPPPSLPEGEGNARSVPAVFVDLPPSLPEGEGNRVALCNAHERIKRG